jgi:hypothetical protein
MIAGARPPVPRRDAMAKLCRPSSPLWCARARLSPPLPHALILTLFQQERELVQIRRRKAVAHPHFRRKIVVPTSSMLSLNSSSILSVPICKRCGPKVRPCAHPKSVSAGCRTCRIHPSMRRSRAGAWPMSSGGGMLPSSCCMVNRHGDISTRLRRKYLSRLAVTLTIALAHDGPSTSWGASP